MALNEKQLEKVNALIAKANDPAATPEESETYLAKAAALMEKYDLTNEDLRRQQATMSGQEPTAEGIVYWTMEIDTRGGHAKSRISALHYVVRAMGGRSYFYLGDGHGYLRKTYFTVVAQESIIDNLKIFLPVMLMRAEVLAEAHGKEAIRRAKADGTFYSNTGCNARRGFMQGFGSGVAHRIRGQRDQEVANGSEAFALVLANRHDLLEEHMNRYHSNLKAGRGQKIDGSSYRSGRQAGIAFGSPGVSSTGRRALNG